MKQRREARVSSPSSSSPTSSPSRTRLVASGASPMSGDTLVKILLRETLGLGRLPGDASGDAQPCRLHTGELFRSLQLPSMDIRLQSQVWNAFTVMRRTPKKAMLWSHLDCQGGLSVPETRPELAYALSENPQNTLAKSKARRVCA